MDIDILDSLEDLGYSGVLLDKEALDKAIELGPNSVEFAELTSWLSKELKELNNLEGCIHPITDAEDICGFMVEVSSFLKELDCPYKSLMEGDINQRLTEKNHRILLLDFLCSDLQSSRISKMHLEGKRSKLDIELETSDTAAVLESILMKFGIEFDENEGPFELFTKLYSKVEQVLNSSNGSLMPPLLKDNLTESQWQYFEALQKKLHLDYKNRREMLLTRLDVTVQSFKWGESSKSKEDQLFKVYNPLKHVLRTEPDVKMSSILAARKDVIELEKFSHIHHSKTQNSKIYKVVIGQVPDRGGRPKEQRPPVEMPSFRGRVAEPKGGGRGGRGDRWEGNFRGHKGRRR